MKFFLFFIVLLFGVAHAQNTSITMSSNLKINCKFEKVIIKNSEYNFETFTKDQIKRNDINELTVFSKTPDTLIIKNLSNFINNIDLELKFLIGIFSLFKHLTKKEIIPNLQF